MKKLLKNELKLCVSDSGTVHCTAMVQTPGKALPCLKHQTSDPRSATLTHYASINAQVNSEFCSYHSIM